MIDDKLKDLVKEEADKLIKNAKKSELEKLDFIALRPISVQLCIYGQMTGDCFSSRAVDLLKKCAKPYTVSLMGDAIPAKNYKSFDKETRQDGVYSPIEFYITEKGAKNKELIAYLKGEADILEL